MTSWVQNSTTMVCKPNLQYMTVQDIRGVAECIVELYSILFSNAKIVRKAAIADMRSYTTQLDLCIKQSHGTLILIDTIFKSSSESSTTHAIVWTERVIKFLTIFMQRLLTTHETSQYIFKDVYALILEPYHTPFTQKMFSSMCTTNVLPRKDIVKFIPLDQKLQNLCRNLENTSFCLTQLIQKYNIDTSAKK